MSKFQSVGSGIFFQQVSLQVLPHLTKRAPDTGDSGAIPGIFLRLSIFLAGRLRRPRPSAGPRKALGSSLQNEGRIF